MDNQSDPRLKIILELWHSNAHLTQRSAATQLGISQSAVCQYLNGKIPLNLEMIIKFSKLFKISPVKIDSNLNF